MFIGIRIYLIKNWRPFLSLFDNKLSKYANGLILRYMLLDCRNKLIKPSRSYVKDKLPFSKLVDNFTIGFIHYAWINYLWYHIFFLFLTFSCMWPRFIWRVFLWKRAFENIWLVKYIWSPGMQLSRQRATQISRNLP